MANLPSKTFLCNYNAKQYDTTTRTFPATEGQTIASGLTFAAAPRMTPHIEDGYITFQSSQSNTIPMRFVYAADNPFNRYNTETGRTLTIIYKCSADFSQSVFGNRGRQDGQTSGDLYNYMVRNNMFHTSVANFLPFTPSSSPCTIYIRVNADGTCERKCIETGQIATSSTINYGNTPSSCTFFAGGDLSLSEYFAGDFYWIYISTDALTDDEITKVIAYNEGTSTFSVDPEEVAADYTSGSTSISVDTDEAVSWSASTEANWISLSSTGGTGSSSFSITWEENSTYSSRNAVITFVSSEGDTAETHITQAEHPVLIPKNNIYREGKRIN